MEPSYCNQHEMDTTVTTTDVSCARPTERTCDSNIRLFRRLRCDVGLRWCWLRTLRDMDLKEIPARARARLDCYSASRVVRRRWDL